MTAPGMDRANDRGARAATKAAWTFALATLMAACGASPATMPAEAPSGPAPIATSAATNVAEPAAPETPDAAFRYVPPELGETPVPLLTALDVTLANGLTARLVESRTSPVAAAYLTVRWKTVAKIPGTGAALTVALERVKTPSGQTLGDELRDLGASWRSTSTQDGLQLRIVALPRLVEPALALVLGALRSGKVDKAILDWARERLQKDNDGESDTQKAEREVDLRLFAAGHRYHDAATGTAESLKKLAPADLTRFRDAAVAPDGVAIAFAGAMTKPEMEALLERVAGGWKAAPKGNVAALPPAALGVFLADRPGDAAIRVVVTVPVPGASRADFATSLVATNAFVQRCYAHLRADSPIARWQGVDRTRTRFDGRMLEWIVDVSAGTAADVVQASIQAMDDLAKGTLPDAELTTARRDVARRVLNADGIDATLMTTAEELLGGASPGALLGVFAAGPAAPRADVLRVAAATFRKDRASVVATGPIAAEKAAFEKLGLGKVTLENAPKIAPAKGGGK